jgi:hypothetical protein
MGWKKLYKICTKIITHITVVLVLFGDKIFLYFLREEVLKFLQPDFGYFLYSS